MRITTLWAFEAPYVNMPWLADHYDEYTAESYGGGVPDFYATKRSELDASSDMVTAELVIEIPDDAVLALFHPPTVEATLIGSDFETAEAAAQRSAAFGPDGQLRTEEGGFWPGDEGGEG